MSAVASEARRGYQDSQELELQLFVNFLTWVLGSKLSPLQEQ